MTAPVSGRTHPRPALSLPASGREVWPAVSALMLLAAFAIRGWQFGTPFIHVDEDFYLFVGDRLLHGALPYVDIWDRKPVGLFLLYAGIRLLGGDGILAYQVVATIFAGATAAIVARIAARYAPTSATIGAGLLYLALLGLNGGMGGQSPVFYNLLVAIAALLAIGVHADRPDGTRIRRRALVAMALCGVALQIKYSVVFEGVFLGIAFMLASWRAGRRPAGLALDAGLWIAVALLPTLLAFAYYVARGYGEAFLYANVFSITQRAGWSAAILLKRLGHSAAIFALPLLSVAIAAWLRPLLPGRAAATAYRVVLAWAGAAFAGYAVFGTYFNHYALPLAAPVAAAAAPVFAIRRRRFGLIAAALLAMLATWRYVHEARSGLRLHGGAPALRTAMATIRPRLRDGCLWVYRGDALLYLETRSCLLSRYAFPGHLWQKSEAGAIGIDPLAEIRRVLTLRPAAIVDEMLHHDNDINPPADALVRAALARDYRLAAVTGRPGHSTLIYVRRR